LAAGLAISALATPSFAQRAEGDMSGEREKALRDCSAEAGKMSQSTWGVQQLHKHRSCMMQRGHQGVTPLSLPMRSHTELGLARVRYFFESAEAGFIRLRLEREGTTTRTALMSTSRGHSWSAAARRRHLGGP
jgi:hypothetical protein